MTTKPVPLVVATPRFLAQLFVLLVVLLASGAPAMAQCEDICGGEDCDCEFDDICAPGLLGGVVCVSEEVPPPPPQFECWNDRRFVKWVNSGCQGWGQDVNITVDVTRFAGPTVSCPNPDADPPECVDPPSSPLLNVQDLIDKQRVGPWAELRIMTYDVDTQPSLCYPAEKNLVLFNGVRIEQLIPFGELGDSPLRGANRAWVETTYQIPISAVKFPGLPGEIGDDLESTGKPSDGDNVVTIRTTQDCRCLAVGWISLEVLVSSPVVLLHGLGENKDFWDPAERRGVTTFTDALTEERFLYRTFTHEADFVAESAGLIRDQLPIIAKSLGVDSLNLIAHSKGGLDGIYYLAHLYDEDMLAPPAPGAFQVVSFTTLDTPLMGSVLADIAGYWWAFLLGAYDRQQFPLFDAIVWGIISPLGGASFQDFTVTEASRIVNTATWSLPRGPEPRAPAYNTVSADLDQSNGGWVSCVPDEGLKIREYFDIPPFPPSDCFLNWVAMNFLYRTLRNTAWVYWDFFEWKVRAVSSGGQEGNDILVTVRSGQGGRGYRSFVDAFGSRKIYEAPEFKTHPSIADEEVARVVIPWLQARETTYPGDLRGFRDPREPLCPSP